jgi:hypothetical protein
MKQLDDSSVISNTKSLPVLMYLVSTVVAYGKLDQLPAGQERKLTNANPFHDLHKPWNSTKSDVPLS